MAYPYKFLNPGNFRLAFRRITYAQNHDYKNFYRHLLSSYQLALDDNLLDLIDDIRRGMYEPCNPLMVYQPKESGVLRPITILCLNDLVVYQALANYLAARMEPQQKKYALTKSFGAILGPRGDPSFFQNWAGNYRTYCDEVAHAYRLGNDYLAEFDLVSFYELIDHALLRRILSKYVNNNEVLDLLFRCLEAWRKSRAGELIHHGIPQGPEPSAFLAECVLFRFDALKLRNVVYLRYIDDIKLMAKEPSRLRRALVRLDLVSKDVGLVPQAQKIEMRKVKNLGDAVRTVPSGLLLAVSRGVLKQATQRGLLRTFRDTLRREGRSWKVHDPTNFKYTLLRLKARRDVLRRIKPLLVKRPDLSWVLSRYLRKFEDSKVASDALLQALRENPVYDAAAMNYILALDVCEPPKGQTPYRRAIQTALKRSEEKSALVRLASLVFRGRRSGVRDAIRLIGREPEPLVRSTAIHLLFEADGSPYKLEQCRYLLQAETETDDPDLSRFCGSLLLALWPTAKSWATNRKASYAVKVLTKALGLRRKGPKKPGVIETFLARKLLIGIPFPWKRALGGGWRDAEQRCLRFQQLELSDPDSRVLMLDTFNEALLQRFSRKHSTLGAVYKVAAGKKPQPDFGVWLKSPALQLVLPKGIGWFRSVHNARVGAQLAHAKHHGGPKKGRATRPIPWKRAEKIIKLAPPAYVELMLEWKKIL